MSKIKKLKAKKAGKVEKIIKPIHPSIPEKVQIDVQGADDFYREIRIENTVEDEKGKQARLKEGADVDIVVEADRSATQPKHKQRRTS